MSLFYIDDLAPEISSDFEIEKDDPSLNSSRQGALKNAFYVDKEQFKQIFFNSYGIGYLADYFSNNRKEFRVVSYPEITHTCYEKVQILGGTWNPLNIVKALYLRKSTDGSLVTVVVPETGCFIDRALVAKRFGLGRGEYFEKARELPDNMTFGTCSPFVVESDLAGSGGGVSKIVFDTETLIMKKHDNTMDDFSFGTDHRFSVQMNYYQCYRMLKRMYPHHVIDEEIMTLSFKQKLIRKNGRIKVNYDFNTINYRTANFINSIHGNGDITIVNDHVDELDLPDILTGEGNNHHY